MLRYALPLFASVALFASPAAAQVQVQSTGPVVELDVFEVIEIEPDIVTMSAGVTTEAPTAVEALRQNSVRMRQVIDRLKALGVAERDIQTSGINLNARFDYDQARREQVFRGYQAGNRVNVTLRDIDGAGAALDALVQAGATDLNGPMFGVDDDSAAKAEARQAAMARGRAMALDYARSAGYSDVRLLRVSESVRGGGPRPVSRDIIVTASANEAAPIMPGRVGTGVSISVTYELVN